LQDSQSKEFRFRNDAIKKTGTGDNLNPIHLRRGRSERGGG
jgi:hypothetical protein